MLGNLELFLSEVQLRTNNTAYKGIDELSI